MPGAFAASLARWREGGRMIPVLSNHETKLERVVGVIDPRTATETSEGLQVTGTLTLDTELGRRTCALIKDNAVAWSTGYSVPAGRKRRNGDLTELHEVDLIEVSVVPAPANERTRTLALKSADDQFRQAVVAILTGEDGVPEAKGTDAQPLKVARFEC
jgi:HK97 family phage prohead protease